MNLQHEPFHLVTWASSKDSKAAAIKKKDQTGFGTVSGIESFLY